MCSWADEHPSGKNYYICYCYYSTKCGPSLQFLRIIPKFKSWSMKQNEAN